MSRLLFVLLVLFSFNVSARMVEEHMDDAFAYSYQKPVETQRKFAGEKEKEEKKKREVASDEIATDTEVKYWKFTP